MTDDERQRWKQRYRNASVEKLQASLANATPEHRRLIDELIDEICRAVDAPYYRRDRQLIWCTLVAAVIGALMGAGASAWFSSRSQEKGPLQPAPLSVATPPASSTDTSAVATPLPTLEESMPTVQGEAATPEESPQTEQPAASEESMPAPEDLLQVPEDFMPAPEEIVPAPEELVPAPEEPVPTPQPQERSN